ncbi:hypothetical protein B0H14DRAFT_3064281 [Mycena olivaceomarginata]|nr:hypothetical protein B0H14DRAFT_3064281 [Mycena olivaceomarginata]
MQLGRLIRSTVTQLPLGYPDTMLDYLPLRPIWVNDHSIILAIASCCRTSTFHWADNRPLVLPPHEAFGFVIDHYAVFDQVIVPMWMWLSICVQAVGIEEVSHSSHQPEWVQTAELLRNVATSNTYNMLAERNKITAWLDQHPISNDLQRAVDEKAGNPEWYYSRNDPVSLAMFLVVMWEGQSLDKYWYKPKPRRIPPPPARHHTAHPPQDLPTPPLPTEGPIPHHLSSHSLRTIPEVLAHPSSHLSPPPASVQNDSAEGDLPDAAAGTSHLL